MIHYKLDIYGACNMFLSFLKFIYFFVLGDLQYWVATQNIFLNVKQEFVNSFNYEDNKILKITKINDKNKEKKEQNIAKI